MKREEKYKHITDYFREKQPHVTSELDYASTFQLLVAVILSAQCTDKRVNMITPELFRHYPTAKDMAQATEDDILEYVHSVSYPNSKALHLVQMARKLISDFNGEVPSTLDELITLPGVGRKTANVIQAVAFDKPAMAVDTHIFRVSHRLGLVTDADNTPYKVEKRLVKHISDEDIPNAHHWLLLHGRYVCIARKPKCEICDISAYCDYFKKNESIKK